MKIAFLNFYSGFVARGGETFVQELATKLAIDNDVMVFQAGPKSSSEYKATVVGHFSGTGWLSELPPIHILRRLFLDRYKLRELIFTFLLIPDLWRLKPDVVIPLNSGWQALICSLYCRIYGARLVITGQSGPGWDDRWNLLMKPHLFVALTSHQLAWAKSATIWKQAFALIPNGVDLQRFSSSGSRAKLDINKPIILMVAASTPDKRVEQGIRAVAKLKSASMLLLGQGPLDERINNLGYKLLGPGRFRHLSVSHNKIAPYYRAASLLTLCSISSEAFGIVYLEAMACGLGCVATDDASRREIVGDAGLFVKDPDDESEYSQVLSAAIKINWREKSLKQASNFSWDKIASQYTKALHEQI